MLTPQPQPSPYLLAIPDSIRAEIIKTEPTLVQIEVAATFFGKWHRAMHALDKGGPLLLSDMSEMVFFLDSLETQETRKLAFEISKVILPVYLSECFEVTGRIMGSYHRTKEYPGMPSLTLPKVVEDRGRQVYHSIKRGDASVMNDPFIKELVSELGGFVELNVSVAIEVLKAGTPEKVAAMGKALARLGNIAFRAESS